MSLQFSNIQHYQAFEYGRDKYHLKKQRLARLRRYRLLELVASGQFEPTANDKLARALGVDRSTVHRDLKVIEEGSRCTHCGQPLPFFVDTADLESGD